MTIALETIELDPNTIIVRERQRKQVDVADLKDSIARRGVLQPIIITRDLVLVVGERRLRSCIELGIKIPVRFFDDLSPLEHSIVELEENLKRTDLPWQDLVHAVGKIHALYLQSDPTWTQLKTGEHLGIAEQSISQILRVHAEFASPAVQASTGWRGAYNVITRVDARRAAVVLNEIMEDTQAAFEHVSVPTAQAETAAATPPPPKQSDAILHMDFLQWAPTYSGPKFNFLHCDFPYGGGAFRKGGFIGPAGSALAEYDDTFETYEALVTCLGVNLERILQHSAHLMFWFSMKHYEWTRQTLSKNFHVNPFPLVWVKNDNAGVTPDPMHDPRQTYETAFYCYRGDRPLVYVRANHYAAPTDKSLHPSAKPEPVLRHFFGMIVDGTTRMLDPTAGSGTAIRVAEEYKAEFVLGLESNKEHVDNANVETKRARLLREMAR